MANNLARLRPLIQNVDPPIFTGANDMLPYDYLEELSTFQVLHGASDIEMLTQVIPWSLRDYACKWLKLQYKFCPFNGMVDFKRRFKNAFETHEYKVKLREYFDKRTQDWNETLVAYIVAINDLYDRLGESPTQKEMVQTILSRLNPYYSPYFAKREKLNTVYELYVEAEKFDTLLAEIRMYKPPPNTGIEPSLLPQEKLVKKRYERKLKSSLKSITPPFEADLGTQTSVQVNSIGSVSTQTLAVVAAQKEISTQANFDSKQSITTEQFTQTEILKTQDNEVIRTNPVSNSPIKANVSKSHLALSADCSLNAETSDSGFDSFSDSNSDIISNAYYSTSALVLEHPLNRKELSMSKLAKTHR